MNGKLYLVDVVMPVTIDYGPYIFLFFFLDRDVPFAAPALILRNVDDNDLHKQSGTSMDY